MTGYLTMLFLEIFLLVCLLALLRVKFAFRIFARDYEPFARRAVPWNLWTAGVIFVLFFLVFPVVCQTFVRGVVARWTPNLDERPRAEMIENIDEETPTPETAEESVAYSDAGKMESGEDVAQEEAPEEIADSESGIATSDAESEPAVESEEASAETETLLWKMEQADTPAPSRSIKKDISTQHPAARLLIRARETQWFGFVAALFFITVVVLAPLAEEFVFRVSLLAALERAFGFGLPTQEDSNSDAFVRDGRLARFFDGRPGSALFLIFAQALIFALLHAGTPESSDAPAENNLALYSMISTALSAVLTLVVGVFFLKKSCGATSNDLGLAALAEETSPAEKLRRLASEWLRGVCLMVCLLPAVYLVNMTFERLFPHAVVAPFAIFLFSFVEGVVYFRTRSCATVVGMHMTLNFSSFALLLALISQNAYW